MFARVSASVFAFFEVVAFAITADAQLIPTVPPVFDKPASTFSSRAASAFEPGQIVDRPTSDLRPRFYWGLIGSVVPSWSTPDRMGPWFFDEISSAKASGRDFRIGIVRGRQIGFEMGVSLVRKTLSDFTIIREGDWTYGYSSRVTYTPLDAMEMTGVDSHFVIPIKRFGERAQLGILGGGGIAWFPDVPIQKRIDGPPFYADAAMTTPLNSPPAAGGFVKDFSVQPVPIVPGTTYGIVTGSSYEISPTDYVWLLMRGQLAVDFLVARPLKVRVAGGFNYPGMQAIGIDGVYLFRTGARSSTAKMAGAPDATAPGQIADRPQVLAPRRSYWGVLGGVTPKWWTPGNWTEFFKNIIFDSPVAMEGRDIRIGITRGRPLGKEFGFSFVQKSVTRFSLLRQGYPMFNISGLPQESQNLIRLTELDTVRMPGVDFHSFIPVDRIGSRVQLGVLLGIGAAKVPNEPIRKRIEGPPFAVDPVTRIQVATRPVTGGYVFDENGQAFLVPPGQNAVDVPAEFIEVSSLQSGFFMARAQAAADVLLAPAFKLRFTAGFNYPGAQLFGLEAVYLFGTGR